MAYGPVSVSSHTQCHSNAHPNWTVIDQSPCSWCRMVDCGAWQLLRPCQSVFFIPDDHFTECLALVKQEKLYSKGLKLFPVNSPQYKVGLQSGIKQPPCWVLDSAWHCWSATFHHQATYCALFTFSVSVCLQVHPLSICYQAILTSLSSQSCSRNYHRVDCNSFWMLLAQDVLSLKVWPHWGHVETPRQCSGSDIQCLGLRWCHPSTGWL